jgi:hypothetical protein
MGPPLTDALDALQALTAEHARCEWLNGGASPEGVVWMECEACGASLVRETSEAERA